MTERWEAEDALAANLKKAKPWTITAGTNVIDQLLILPPKE
jgi:hypothetical protein